MIKFFRKIRQNLLMENKTGKYFKYAFGEIILVVIGILIALQINNWNELRKERKLENKLLDEVSKSIKADTTSLNLEKRIFDRILYHGNLIREKIDNDEPYEKSLDSSFAIINTFVIQEADYKAFERIENVGIEIITNEELKKSLINYYDKSKFVASVENGEIGDIFMQKVYPKFFKRFAYAQYAVPIDFEKLKNESEFLIHLDYCINDAKWYRGQSMIRKKWAIRLIGILDKELKK